MSYVQIFLFGLLAFVGSPGYADSENGVEELAQELFLSDLVYLQEEQELQLSTGIEWGEQKGISSFTTSIDAEYGITDSLQVGVEIPVQYGGSLGLSGIGNAQLEGAYSFYNDRESGWAFAVVLGLGLPRLSDDVGKEKLFFEPTFVAYKDVSIGAFNLSIGVELPSDSAEEKETEIGLSFLHPLKGSALSFELASQIEGSETAISFAPGFHFVVAKHFDMALGFAVGLNDEATDWQGFVSFSREWEL